MSSEFEVLINTICNPSTNLTNRSTAEARLLDLLSNIHTWQQYITLFSSSNDMICFFLGIGYQRLVWRHWTDLSVEQHNLLLNTMKQALTNRPLMQNFTQAKIEQVLAAICCNLLNLDPILNMLVDVNQPQAVIGLSATRTVFDLIVSDDPKLNPKTKATLLQQIQSPQVLLPITNLAGSACAKALQSYNEDTLNLMTIALELLKIIIGKMTLGAHITVDILNLLFTIAELGADPKSVFHRTALSSIEILTEIMTKKYIPASTSGDRGISMVIHLVNKTLALLKSYREHGNIDDSDIVLQLLEFTTMFAESHLERCIEHSNGMMGNNNQLQQSITMFFNELVSITTVSSDPKVLSKIVSLWNHVLLVESVKELLLQSIQQVVLPIMSHLLMAVLSSSNTNLTDEVEELIADLKIESIVDPHLKEVLLTVSTLSSSAADNKLSSEGTVHSAEEFDHIGSTMIAEVKELFVELVMTTEVKEWLHNAIKPLLSRHIQSILNMTQQSIPMNEDIQRSILDLMVLIRILPSTCMDVVVSTGIIEQAALSMNNSSLLLYFLQVFQQLLDCNYYHQAFNQHKECVVLQLNMLQIMNHLLPTTFSTLTPSHQQQWMSVGEQLLLVLIRCIVNIIQRYEQHHQRNSGTDLVLQGLVIFFTQCVTLFAEIFATTSYQQIFQEMLEKLHFIVSRPHLVSMEVYSLLLCTQDMVLLSGRQPSQAVARSQVGDMLVQQFSDLTTMLIGTIASSNFNSLSSSIESILMCMGSLDVLTRHHALAKATRRQAFIASLLPLQELVPKAAQCLYQIYQEVWRVCISRRYNSSLSTNGIEVIPLEPMNKIVRLLLSMTCALLQCLGKKTFGKMAGDVLELHLLFIERCTTSNSNSLKIPLETVNIITPHLTRVYSIQCSSHNPANDLVLMLFDSNGCKCLWQGLELARIIAESTNATSTTTTQYVQFTYTLIVSITPYLADERVCAELLQATLKAGIVATRSYWQKANKPFNIPHLSQLAGNAQVANGCNAVSSGENVSFLVHALVTLCIGSLGSNVPPQDTLLALEGMLSLREQHALFSVPWFHQQGIYQALFLPVLRAIVLRMHMIHYHALESLFLTLCDAKLNLIKQDNQAHGDQIVFERAREFWYSIAEEMVKIAAEYQCAEHTHAIISNAFQTLNAMNTQVFSSSQQSNTLLDTQQVMKEMIVPVIAEISKRN